MSADFIEPDCAEAIRKHLRAIDALLESNGGGKAAGRTWPPPTVQLSDPYWQWTNLEDAAAHGPFKATKLFELRELVSLKVEGRRHYSLTQIWREHRPR